MQPIRTQITIIFLLLLTTSSVYAQEYSTIYNSELIESMLESIAEDLDAEGASISILEDLNELAKNPININDAAFEDLEKLFFLTDYQKQNLLTYRDKYSQIYSFYEIENIEGFDRNITSKLTPFLHLGNSEPYQYSFISQEINLRTSYTFEKAEGFKENEDGNSKYSGIRPAIYTNYRANYGKKIYWGITLENDPGEDFFKASNKHGFDFNSGFVMFQPQSIFNKVIIGNYGIRLGQGLTQWTGYSTRKSIEIPSIRYSGQGIRPYTSSMENGYFQGVAAEMSLNKFKWIVFTSAQKQDANKIETPEETYVSALQNSGLHRTIGEIEDENSLKNQTFGTSLHYAFSKIEFGINTTYQHFSLPVIPKNRLSNSFKFSGQTNHNSSFDFHGRTKLLSYFGEFAVSKSKGTAAIVGMEGQPANQLQFNILYRNIDAHFHTVGGSAFTEWSSVQNEEGLYTSILFLPFQKMQCNMTVDLYKSKWMRYNTNSPVKGIEWISQMSYRPIDLLKFTARFKFKRNNEKSIRPLIIKEDIQQTNQRTRLQVDFTPTDNWKVKARVEYASYEKEDSSSQGIFAFLETSYHLLENDFKLAARVGWFNIENYDSRIYTYELDVPSLFYIPSFAGQGIRYYLVTGYKLGANLNIYLKLSQTSFSKDVVAISTGNSKIAGNRKSDFRLQIKYRF